jgi:hypothetical protein
MINYMAKISASYVSYSTISNVYDKRKSQTSECHKKSYLHNKIQDIIPKTNPNH